MTCADAREYLYAFLDDELDAALSIELQRHLERCPLCAQDAEIERTIRRRLATALEAASPTPSMDDESVQCLCVHGERAQAASDRAGTRRRMLAAACVVLAVLLGIGGYARFTRRTSIELPATEVVFSSMLVADFEHFVATGSPVQFASADPAHVARWVQSKTGLAISVPPALPGRTSLIGARKCILRGQPAAFLHYMLGDVPSALIVMAPQPDATEGMTAVHTHADTHWVDHQDGHTVITCERRDLVYAAVSTLPENQLELLMAGGTHEGD